MSDPLSFLILGSGAAAMTNVGYNVIKSQPVIVPISNTPTGVTTSSNYKESSFVFDDASTGPETLWSAAKISQTVKNRQGMTIPRHISGNIALFGLQDSNVRVDDSSFPDSSVLWSSIKVKQAASSIQKGNVALNSANKNVAKFSNVGEPEGSNFVFDDSVSTPNAIWSSEKISTLLKSSKGMKLVPAAKQGNAAAFDGVGQLTDSRNIPSSSFATISSISSKLSNKLPSFVAPAKHLAWAKSDGTIQDSGCIVDPNSAASAKIIWPSTRVQSAITDAKNAMSSDIAQNVAGSTKSVVVSPLIMPSTTSKMNLYPSAVAGDIAVYNSSGQAIDSGNKMNDLGKEKTDIWSAIKIQQELDNLATTNLSSNETLNTSDLTALQKQVDQTVADASKKMNKLSSTSKYVSTFDSSTGNLKDGGFSLDDGSTAFGKSYVWSAATIANFLATSNKNTQSQINSLSTAATNLETVLNGKMNLVQDAGQQNVAIFNDAGQLVDSTNSVPMNAFSISSKLATKAAGSGTANMLASWSSPTALKSSGVAVSDLGFTSSNVMTSQGIVDGTAMQLAPFTFTDSQKAYFLYKIENWTHPGPAYKNNTANYLPAAYTLVESNVTTPASRGAYFRVNFFGAVISPNNGFISISPEAGKRQDTVLPANAIVPAYFSNLVARTAPFQGVGVAVDPGPATILFGYVSIVEL